MFYRVAEGFTWHSDVGKKHRFFIFPNNFSFFLTMARKEKKKKKEKLTFICQSHYNPIIKNFTLENLSPRVTQMHQSHIL